MDEGPRLVSRKIVVAADTHLNNHPVLGGPLVGGRNERCRRIESAIATVAAFAAKNGATLVLAGDVFDTAYPTPQMVHALGLALSKTSTRRLLAGNHDRVTTAPSDHALAPLALQDGTDVIDTVRFIDGVGYIPPPPRGQSAAEWFDAAFADVHAQAAGETIGAIVTHVGIVHPGAPVARISKANLPQEIAFKLMRQYEVRRLFAGDWHERHVAKQGGMVVEQIGALVPAGWDEQGPDFGYATLYDLDTYESKTVKVPGPRFYVTDSKDEAVKLKEGGAYVKLAAPRGTIAPEGVLLTESAVRSERTADEVRASTALSVDAAFCESVNEMIVPQLREQVLAKVRQAWSSASD